MKEISNQESTRAEAEHDISRASLWLEENARGQAPGAVMITTTTAGC